jgi:hypothetical protein
VARVLALTPDVVPTYSVALLASSAGTEAPTAPYALPAAPPYVRNVEPDVTSTMLPHPTK